MGTRCALIGVVGVTMGQSIIFILVVSLGNVPPGPQGGAIEVCKLVVKLLSFSKLSIYSPCYVYFPSPSPASITRTSRPTRSSPGGHHQGSGQSPPGADV